MKSLTIGLVILLLIVLSGCSPAVKFSYDENVNFHRFKTYAWSGVTAEGLDEMTVNNARAAVNQQLAAKGLREVTSNPDFYVSVDIDRRLVWYSDNSFPDYRYRYMYSTSRGSYASRGALAWSRQYEKELLTLKLTDKDRQQVIWEGSLKTVTDPVQSDAKEVKDFEKSLSKILANYPPPEVRRSGP